MINILKFVTGVVTIGFFIFYLSLPNFSFPEPPFDSYQSVEDADIETPFRRAYFTNFTRDEVLNHYEKQLKKSDFLGFLMPTYSLNYPPEDAFSLIRDQTRSTFLEEIVHPFRGSLFVNGFKPKVAKDEIWYKGKHFEQKITVKYSPSNVYFRIPIFLVAIVFIHIIISAWGEGLKNIISICKK